MVLGAKNRHQLSGNIGPQIPNQTVGELSGADSMDSIAVKNPVKLPQHVAVIDKILQQRRMEIGLQNAVSAVHVTVSTDVQNFITAAGISARARASFDEGTVIASQKQYGFAHLDGRLLRSKIRILLFMTLIMLLDWHLIWARNFEVKMLLWLKMNFSLRI